MVKETHLFNICHKNFIGRRVDDHQISQQSLKPF
jgi:hypothetical protein